VALIASSLAYGRVAQILGSVSAVLGRMGPSPYEFLLSTPPDSLWLFFSSFKHRYTTSHELVEFLIATRGVLSRYGSLRECFGAGLKDGDETVLPALERFVDELRAAHKGGDVFNSLLPSPRLGSACKRLNLFLRWMVREDDVDPGGWHDVSPSRLVIPVDTHIHRMGLALRLTDRKSPDIRCALEITEALRGLAPEDPVRYDFALTRLGIREDADPESFLDECKRNGNEAHA